jgi:casein kinase II subunit beta
VAARNLAPGLGPGNIYEPRIYGFKVSEVAKTGPRMKWLRSRPVDINELDEVRLWTENQEHMASQADLADSEMIDGNEEINEGEMEDEEMEIEADGEQPQPGYEIDSAQIREVTQRKKPSRRRNHEAVLNGNAGGTAVRVGDGG